MIKPRYKVVNPLLLCAIFHFQAFASQTMGYEGREAQFPKTNITTVTQRECIKNSMPKPLIEKGRVAMALRIMWRNNEEMVWSQILAFRLACDKFLTNLDGVALFVSAITGTTGKAKGDAGRMVYPGLGFWIVLQAESVDPRAIVRNLQTALKGQAEIKLLQEPPIIKTVDTMTTTLCIVLKDHSNSYIKRRMSACQHDEMGRAAVRIVTKHNELAPFARQAEQSFQSGGVYVDVVHY